MELFPREFFCEDAVTLAPKLLGHKLVVYNKGNYRSGIIVETEAYMPNDPACHAYRKKTRRNAPMFEAGGIAYVYFIYGMYYCFNVVTGPKGSGQAVLIRAIAPLSSSEHPKVAAGPGKLCKYLGIDISFNGEKLWEKTSRIFIAQHHEDILCQYECVQSTRIGISCGQEYMWRWYLNKHPSVSRQ